VSSFDPSSDSEALLRTWMVVAGMELGLLQKARHTASEQKARYQRARAEQDHSGAGELGILGVGDPPEHPAAQRNEQHNPTDHAPGGEARETPGQSRVRTTILPGGGTRCPDCGNPVELATGGAEAPSEGNLTVCGKCAAVSAFGPGMKLRRVTDLERKSWPTGLVLHLAKIRENILALNRARPYVFRGERFQGFQEADAGSARYKTMEALVEAGLASVVGLPMILRPQAPEVMGQADTVPCQRCEQMLWVARDRPRGMVVCPACAELLVGADE